LEVVRLGFVEKRTGKYLARYRDPLGRQRSKTFVRKADAQRFLVDMESAKARGSWIDPRQADQPLADWAEERVTIGPAAGVEARDLGGSSCLHWQGVASGVVLGRLPARHHGFSGMEVR
jgi:hypothetical protein